jgi:deoxyribonuclease-4
VPLGVHVSIEGGVSMAIERARELGCDALQCFGANPRGWQGSALTKAEARRFRALREGAGIAVVAVHASYLINISSPSDALFARSIKALEKELSRAALIGADFLVVHLGSSLGKGKDFAIERAGAALDMVASIIEESGVELLLENTAGAGHTTGASLSDVGALLKGRPIGFCFDTCHAFAAGYPMKTPADVSLLVDAIKRNVGLKRLKLIHVNDSKGECGSRLDRHEHVGRGQIGLEGFRAFLGHPAVKDVPLILETPKDSSAADKRNLAIVRNMM